MNTANPPFAMPSPRAWLRSRLSLEGWIGLVILVGVLLLALFGPLLAPQDPAAIVSDRSWAPAGVDGLLGTDRLGRDLLSRLLHGAQLTIGLALAACLLSFLLGSGLGFASAVMGGRIDSLLSRMNDLFLSFPPLILALLVIAALGSSVAVLILTMAFIDATRVYRVARATAMDVVARDFVDVARARGESTLWIMFREVLPNTLRPLAAEFGIRFTYSILFLSSLSFLGLGIQPPAADWGSLVQENLAALMMGSWAALYPAAAIALVTIGVNLLLDDLSR